MTESAQGVRTGVQDMEHELQAGIYGQPIKVSLGGEIACCGCACCGDTEIGEVAEGICDHRMIELPVFDYRGTTTVLCMACLQKIAAEALAALVPEACEYGEEAMLEYEASLAP